MSKAAKAFVERSPEVTEQAKETVQELIDHMSMGGDLSLVATRDKRTGEVVQCLCLLVGVKDVPGDKRAVTMKPIAKLFNVQPDEELEPPDRFYTKRMNGEELNKYLVSDKPLPE